ncbi:MAG: hypothetical protein NW226_26760 [Microscillaceae bacterium]|nr:hypothetical protein [Microscillaceae bacterium]
MFSDLSQLLQTGNSMATLEDVLGKNINNILDPALDRFSFLNVSGDAFLLKDPNLIEEAIELLWTKINFSVGSDQLPYNYHLIYAFLVENTGLVRALQKVLYLYIHGEALGMPSQETARWLQNTEQLFYQNHSFKKFLALRSTLRPNFEATRRNIYFRMFGSEVDYGAGSSTYKYTKSNLNNENFSSILDRVFTLVWQGIINSSNLVGADATDDIALFEMLRILRELLTARRGNIPQIPNSGDYSNLNITREEFLSVVMVMWFRRAMQFQPLMEDLSTTANTDSERIFKLGRKVSVAIHPKTRYMLDLAPLMAIFLRLLERGDFDDLNNVRSLYDKNSALGGQLMMRLLNYWEQYKGIKLKSLT